MNLIYEKDLKSESHFCVILIFNHFNKSSFRDLKQAIMEKKPLVAELCSAVYEEVGLNEQYRLESDEGETVIIPYDDMLFYLNLAVQRFIDIYAANSEQLI